MIDKKYLEDLREEDYIAWDDLVNDPVIIGTKTITPAIIIILIMSLILILTT